MMNFESGIAGSALVVILTLMFLIMVSAVWAMGLSSMIQFFQSQSGN